MAIRNSARFDEYAYRIANASLAAAVVTSGIEEGQWVTYDTDGNLVVAGAASVKAFIAIGSKRTGRDQVSGKAISKIAYLHGAFVLETSKYDTNGTYTAAMTPLKLASGGILTPCLSVNKTVAKTGVAGTVTGAASATDIPALDIEHVVAYAIGAPSTDGYLKIISA